MMRLYSYWRSSSAWRVRIGLALKDLPYEYVAVNLLAREQFDPEYQARNPMGQVPVLEVSEHGYTVRLAQSMAILEWLEERHPQAPLLPRDLDGRARVRTLGEHVNSGIQPLQNAIVLRTLREKLPGYEKEWAALWIRRGLDALERALQDDETGRVLPRRRARARRLLPRAAAVQRATLRPGPRRRTRRSGGSRRRARRSRRSRRPTRTASRTPRRRTRRTP